MCNRWRCRYIIHEWTSVYSLTSTQNVIGNCGDELLHAINCIGTYHQTDNRKKWRANHKTNKSSQRPHTSAKENMVWIRSPYPDSRSGLLPKFNGDFFVQGHICNKNFFNENPITLSRDISQTAEKRPISQCWTILYKSSWIQIWRWMTSKI